MTENLKPESLSKRRAVKIIRKAAENSANIKITDHAFDRMDAREIIMTQVLRVLRTGTLFDAPVNNPLYDNWECGVNGFPPGKTSV